MKQKPAVPAVVNTTPAVLAENPEGTKWSVTTTDPNRYAAVYHELFGGAVQRNALTLIQVPPGGGKNWQVPSLTGPQSSPEIVGVILNMRLSRVYYDSIFGAGEKRPPSCSSPDGFRGQGKPGGVCYSCPMNEWSSSATFVSGSKDAVAKACKERVHIYFWIPDRRLPCLVDGPTMSTKALKEYRRLLYEAGIEPYEVLTEMTLTITKNKAGIAYGEISPRIRRMLNDEEKRVTTAMAQGLERFIPTSSFQETGEPPFDNEEPVEYNPA